MADAIRRFAKAAGLALADVYSEYAYGDYDGIHPGNLGHKHLADTYLKALLGHPSEPQRKARVAAVDLKSNGDGSVADSKSGLMWLEDAGALGEMMTPAEAEAAVARLNEAKHQGHADWRLPTRDELLSLIDPGQRPSLPKGHPFRDVQRRYLSSTQEMGRNFMIDSHYGGVAYWYARMDDQRGHIWPVRPAK